MKRTRKPVTKPAASSRRSARYAPQLFCPNPFDADAIAEHSNVVRSAPWLASLGLPAVESAPLKPGFRILCVMPDLETRCEVVDAFVTKRGVVADQIIAWLDEHGDDAELDRLRAEEAALARRRDIAADFNLQLRLMKLAETLGFVVDIVAEGVATPRSITKSQICVDCVELQSGDIVDPATYDVVFIDANDRHARALERCGAKRIVLVGDCKNQPHAIAPTLTACYRVVADELMLQRRQLGFEWAAPDLPLPVPTLDDAALDEAILRLAT